MSFLLVICVVLYSIKGEFLIKDGRVPSYLYHHFDVIDEDIFPQELKINMSLSTLSGIIFYSIDKHGNQLIVTLKDSKEVTLGIEFNKQTFLLSMDQLCGCKSCRYKMFEIKIQMREDINIRCNSGIVARLKYVVTNRVNLDYPIPFPNLSTDITKENEAHLWLVNHQEYGLTFPNHNQISGCIFDVKYKSSKVIFLTPVGDIELMCKKYCIGDICHGGKCYETFNEEPVCDCTDTFRNGLHCTGNISPKNLKLTQNYMFQSQKLSWNSFTNEIYSLENTNVRIRLFRSDNLLTFEYKNMKNEGYHTKTILSEHYSPNREYILIIILNKSEIELQLHAKEKWRKSIISTDLDTSKEIFTSLYLRSGNGTIDIAVKSYNNRRWMDVETRHHIVLDDEQPLPGSNNDTIRKCQDISKKYKTALIIISVAFSIFIAAKLYFRFCKGRQMRCMKCKEKSGNKMANTSGNKSALSSMESEQLSEWRELLGSNDKDHKYPQNSGDKMTHIYTYANKSASTENELSLERRELLKSRVKDHRFLHTA